MPEFALPYEQAAMHNEEMPAGLSISAIEKQRLLPFYLI